MTKQVSISCETSHSWQGGDSSTKTDTSGGATSGPTVGSKLGDAWQSTKEATGLAGERVLRLFLRGLQDPLA